VKGAICSGLLAVQLLVVLCLHYSCILFPGITVLLFFSYSLQESYSYRDPITEFVECLYVHFDFDQAQQKLVECEKVKGSL